MKKELIVYKILILALIPIIIFACKKNEIINNDLGDRSNEMFLKVENKTNEFIFSNDSINEINKNVFRLEYIQEDYRRDDLFFILGYTVPDDIFEMYKSMGLVLTEEERKITWKISPEELEKQGSVTLNELIKNTDIIKFITISSNFAYNILGQDFSRYPNTQYYQRTQFFKSVEYITVNNELYGNNKNIKRNDWVILLTYHFYTDDNNYSLPIVFMLPDYRIIISSDNHEGVKINE
jgi:hypothetical protein